MIILNFSNIESLIFENPETHKLFPPHYYSYFSTWKMGKMVPVLRQLGKDAVYKLLNSITDNELLELEKYFQDKIVVEKLSYKAVTNYKIPISQTYNMCDVLCEIIEFGNTGVYRDKEYLYITFWR